FYLLPAIDAFNHLANSLPAALVDDGRAGLKRLCSGHQEPEHALFEFAKILHARDDFLAGITAFLEADSAEQVQVEHLRNEAFAGLQSDPAYALRIFRHCHCSTGAAHTCPDRLAAKDWLC